MSFDAVEQNEGCILWLIPQFKTGNARLQRVSHSAQQISQYLVIVVTCDINWTCERNYMVVGVSVTDAGQLYLRSSWLLSFPHSAKSELAVHVNNGLSTTPELAVDYSKGCKASQSVGVLKMILQNIVYFNLIL